MISNLLHNAAEFTEADGFVSIHLSVRNGRAAISVCDTGPGIETLRLPLVKKLAELHGGRICAESKGLEQGATFTLYLPVIQ